LQVHLLDLNGFRPPLVDVLVEIRGKFLQVQSPGELAGVNSCMIEAISEVLKPYEDFIAAQREKLEALSI